MKSVFTRVALPLLLLFIVDDGLLPSTLSVKAFPAEAISTSNPTNNQTTTTDATVTEYPVFISVTEEETQISPETEEPEVVTETYMIVEDQEVDDDDDDDASTMSPAIVRSTTPMQSPKSSPEQEEVLRELKKLWDLSEGMSDNGNDSLKNSLSSIVHLAYARVYVEPDETLLKLKYLLQQLQERILLGNNLNVRTEREKRRKRSIYDHDVEAIFFANVNSEENSVIPEEAKGQHDSSFNNASTKGPVDRTLLSLSTISSTSSVISVSTTTPSPSTVVQKVVHIHDRQKPMSSFFLSPERIKELKSRVTHSTTTTTSTLSPISIAIEDELENEVNHLQQQQNVDNYDIHISSSESLGPLTTATPPASTMVKSPSSSSTTEFPYSAEDIALALFQLLRPETFDEDESDENVTMQPHPTPSSILYQVGSLSSVLNFTINRAQNISTSTTTTAATVPSKIQTPLTSTMATLSLLQLKEKFMTKDKNNNSTLVVPAPPALLDLATAAADLTTSTERQSQNLSQNNDVYDYTHVLDPTETAADQTSITTNIMQGTQESMQQMMGAVTRLSVGAKMVLLFSVSISILSIGFGIYALGPPLTGVGVLGIVIPIGLLLLFETTAPGGKRKLTTRQREQLLINKLQSEEFSKVLDMIFDAVIKYSKG